MPAIIPILATAATTIASADSARKARNQAADAAKNSQVDIDALDTKTREIAKQNALDAAALEKQLTPEVPQLRTAANQAVLGGIGGNQEQSALAKFMAARFGQPASTTQFANTPLLNDALAKARADLAMGGRLSLDQQNEATRRGAATAASVGGGNLGLGRDLAARDLGLTSYNVEQQRLANAANLGGLETNRNAAMANFGLNQDSLNANNFLNQYSALNSYYNNLRQQDLAAAAYGQSIAQPTVGLDPSAVANLTVANKNNYSQALMNSANVSGQQGKNWMGFGGQLIGYGIGAMGGGGGAAAAAPAASSGAGTVGFG